MCSHTKGKKCQKIWNAASLLRSLRHAKTYERAAGVETGQPGRQGGPGHRSTIADGWRPPVETRKQVVRPGATSSVLAPSSKEKEERSTIVASSCSVRKARSAPLFASRCPVAPCVAQLRSEEYGRDKASQRTETGHGTRLHGPAKGQGQRPYEATGEDATRPEDNWRTPGRQHEEDTRFANLANGATGDEKTRKRGRQEDNTRTQISKAQRETVTTVFFVFGRTPTLWGFYPFTFAPAFELGLSSGSHENIAFAMNFRPSQDRTTHSFSTHVRC